MLDQQGEKTEYRRKNQRDHVGKLRVEGSNDFGQRYVIIWICFMGKINGKAYICI